MRVRRAPRERAKFFLAKIEENAAPTRGNYASGLAACDADECSDACGSAPIGATLDAYDMMVVARRTADRPPGLPMPPGDGARVNAHDAELARVQQQYHLACMPDADYMMRSLLMGASIVAPLL